MHGFDAKLDCLVLRERVALLHAAQGFAAEGDFRQRLKQLAVELDSLGWRCGNVEMVAPEWRPPLNAQEPPEGGSASQPSKRTEGVAAV